MKDYPKIQFLYPSSALKATQVDEFFDDEIALPHKPILYSSYENRLVLRGVDIEGTTIIYRGWILTSYEYSQMAELVESKGAQMLISPDYYKDSQFAEGWLEVFEDDTPSTVVYPYDISSEIIQKDFSHKDKSFVVKGSSKSLKHDWDNSMFAKNSSDVLRVINNFRDQVSKTEENKILVRDFENLLPNEFRVWWANDEFYIAQHPNNDEILEVTPEIEEYVSELWDSVVALNAKWVTTDIARTVDGGFRVIEVGNAQVSGADDFKPVIKALYNSAMFEHLFL